jgi:uncharacterized protein YbcI
MEHKTRGQIEARISEAIIKFEKDYMGRGPRETKTHIFEDMVLVRLNGVLTPAEEQLSKSREGSALIKETRARLLENAKPLLQQIVADTTNCQLISLHSDISTKTGERIIIFVLNCNLEEQLKA